MVLDLEEFDGNSSDESEFIPNAEDYEGEEENESDKDDENSDIEPRVLTRSKRKIIEAEEIDNEKTKKARYRSNDTEKGSESIDRKTNIDALWTELNEDKSQESKSMIGNTLEEHKITGFQNSTLEDQMITITKTYEFAGEIVTEQRRVRVDSEEAKAYIASLNSTAENNNISEAPASSSIEEKKPIKSLSNSTKKPRSPVAAATAERGKFGRPKSNLNQLAASLNKKPVKINTLEKSKMDWKKYVEKEGIVHELKYHNKNGFVEKQEFLQRTYEAQDSEIKALRRGVKK